MRNPMKATGLAGPSGALLLALLVVAAALFASPSPARAPGAGEGQRVAAPVSEIGPGTASAERDTLDLQLD